MNTNERIKIFKSLMGQVFGKEDVDYFVSTLKRMGYFTAPASTKNHGNYEGGLFDHSLEVTKSLLHLTKHLKLHWNSRKSPYFVGMFHDLCKCDNYIHNGDGTYSYNPNVTLPGHGEKSLVLLEANDIGVTEEEKACIRWHMGAWGINMNSYEDQRCYDTARNLYPLVSIIQTADGLAASIMERTADDLE